MADWKVCKLKEKIQTTCWILCSHCKIKLQWSTIFSSQGSLEFMHRSNICLEFLMTIFFLCGITGYLEVAEIKLLLEPSGNWFVIYPVTLNKTFVCLSDFTKALHESTGSNLFIGVLIVSPGAWLILKLRNEFDLFWNNLKQNFFSDSLEIKQTNKQKFEWVKRSAKWT